MTKASIEFRGRKIDETRNYLLDEKKHDLMCKKYKKTCKYLNYVEHLLILASTITGCISIFAFTSLSWFLLVLRINQKRLAHNGSYADSKAFAKRTISDKIMKDRPYEIARNCNYDGYQ